MSSNQTSQIRRTQGPSTINASTKRGNRPTNGKNKSNSSGPASNWNPVGSSGGKWSSKQAGNSQDDDEDDEDMCLICAEKLSIIALSPCNHPTCHKCSLRQRSLYEKKQCLFCRSDIEDMIFTDDLKKSYNELNNGFKFEYKDEKLGIRFTSKAVMDQSMQLLKFTCPFGDLDKDFGSYKKLNEHLKNDHTRTLCMICAGQKKAFPSELEVMTTKQLKNHESRGDAKGGFKGHPLCGFCSAKRFYSDDELYKHMRLSHERCHICDQIDSSQPQYFKGYEDLFQHFRTSHHVCTVQTCLDAKFVVFRDELDLRAHIIKEHPHLTGDSRRAMTLIDNNPKKFRSEISTFSNPTRMIDVQQDHSNPANSRETKRKRMEQRARHYLSNSDPDYQSFVLINDLFNKNEITAQELYSKYEQLFKTHKNDVHLLIFDLSELYHSTSEKHKQLRAIYESIQSKKENAAKFKPLVSDAASAVNVVRGKWGQKGSTPVGGSNVKFTSLPPVSDPIFSSKVSYTGLKNNRSSTPTPVVKTGLSSKSSSSASLNYAKTGQSTTTVVAAQPTVTAIRSSTPTSFPKLQAPKQKRFVAPPISKPTIPDPTLWGKKEPSLSNLSTDSFDLNSVDQALPASGKKKKNKQKQLLFHIGV